MAIFVVCQGLWPRLTRPSQSPSTLRFGVSTPWFHNTVAEQFQSESSGFTAVQARVGLALALGNLLLRFNRVLHGRTRSPDQHFLWGVGGEEINGNAHDVWKWKNTRWKISKNSHTMDGNGEREGAVGRCKLSRLGLNVQSLNWDVASIASSDSSWVTVDSQDAQGAMAPTDAKLGSREPRTAPRTK